MVDWGIHAVSATKIARITTWTTTSPWTTGAEHGNRRL